MIILIATLIFGALALFVIFRRRIDHPDDFGLNVLAALVMGTLELAALVIAYLIFWIVYLATT